MITAATSAKIAMQIAVTNQKTKSIRPACSLAECGSHGIRSATRAAPAPQATPIATSWTIDPLRTAARLLDGEARPPREVRRSKRLLLARFSGPESGYKRRTTQGGMNGTRSKHLADRGRRDPRLCRQR